MPLFRRFLAPEKISVRCSLCRDCAGKQQRRNQKAKRYLALALAVLLLFGLTACAGKTPSTETQTPAASETTPAADSTESGSSEEPIIIHVWSEDIETTLPLNEAFYEYTNHKYKIEYTPKPQEDGKCHLSLSPNLLFCWNHCGFQQNSCFCQQVQILTGANLRCCPRCWLFSCLGVYFHLRILPESTERSAAAILGRSAPSFLFMVRFRIFCCRQDFPPQFHDNTGTNVFQ